MSSKSVIWVGMILGSFLGSNIPTFWGAGIFSFASLIMGSLGAVMGVWIAFKFSR